MQRIIVITGTDTGVGKTLLIALLAAHLIRTGMRVAALKPICSGGRADARLLRRALGNILPLDTINPWHFPAPVAPLLAARKAGRAVTLREVTAHVRAVTRDFEVVLVEGAGGLLSPLGEGFSTRELSVGLGAEVVVVSANRLGTVNHIRLTLDALPAPFAKKARIVLMSIAKPDGASRSNAALLAEWIGRKRLMVLPHFTNASDLVAMLAAPTVSRVLDRLLA